jgi:glutaryl-CoA dehydrogenase
MSDISMVRPDPRDFLDIDSLLNDEEILLRDTVRRFVADRILPDIGDWWDEGIFPREVAKEMAGLGLFGMHLEGYGCAGTSNVAYGLACTELEYGDSGCAFVHVGAGFAFDVPDLEVRLGGTEADLAATDGGW